MIDVDRGVVRQLTYSPAWHAAPDDAGAKICLRHQCPGSRAAHLRGRRRPRRRRRVLLRQRGLFGGQALGRAVSLQRRTGRGRGGPAHPPSPAIFSGRLARRVHLRQDRPRADLRSAMRMPMPESQRVRQELGPAWITGMKSRPLAHGALAHVLGDPAEAHALDFLVIARPTSAPARSWESPTLGAGQPRKSAPSGDLRTDRARLRDHRDGVRNSPHRHHPSPPRDDPRDVSRWLLHQHRRRAGDCWWATQQERRRRALSPTEPAGLVPRRHDRRLRAWLMRTGADGYAGRHRRFPFNHGAPDRPRRSAPIGVRCRCAAVRFSGAAEQPDGIDPGLLALVVFTLQSAAENARPLFIAHAPGG